jgi:hypothetical protein
VSKVNSGVNSVQTGAGRRPAGRPIRPAPRGQLGPASGALRTPHRLPMPYSSELDPRPGIGTGYRANSVQFGPIRFLYLTPISGQFAFYTLRWTRANSLRSCCEAGYLLNCTVCLHSPTVRSDIRFGRIVQMPAPLNTAVRCGSIPCAPSRPRCSNTTENTENIPDYKSTGTRVTTNGNWRKDIGSMWYTVPSPLQRPTALTF